MKKTIFLSGLLLSILLISRHLNAQTYVGSAACAPCHDNATWDFKNTNWAESGHPYKFNVIQNATPPTYPSFVTNFQNNWMAQLGDSTLDWSDIAGVIGGFGWKARFVGHDGHIIGTAGSAHNTGLGHNQFNFAGGVDHGWSNYDATLTKKYNYGCFKCHTTGGDTAGTWLATAPGLGTFSEGGIGCEACHGPGSAHISAPSSSNIDRVYEQVHIGNTVGGLEENGVIQTPNPAGNDINFMCGTCHNRDYKSPINSSGGFIKHHEQWDEMTATSHKKNAGHTCITCHDPHKRAQSHWGPAPGGIKVTCESCHPNQAATINHLGTQSCIECHMPYAVKSGVKRGSSGYKADVRSHLFAINTDTASMFTADGAWVLDDVTRSAALSPHFACLGCHNDSPTDTIPDKTIVQASAQAINMHGTVSVTELQRDLSMSIYPNPTNSSTNIKFYLANSETVKFVVYNAIGEKVYSLNNGYAAGSHKIIWNCTNDSSSELPSGIYYIKLSTNSESTLKKVVIMK